ncbi:MAG: Spy/CpxP family protein refolding chaperone [Ectothiorhodospiraceae bacterium]
MTDNRKRTTALGLALFLSTAGIAGLATAQDEQRPMDNRMQGERHGGGMQQGHMMDGPNGTMQRRGQGRMQGNRGGMRDGHNGQMPPRGGGNSGHGGGMMHGRGMGMSDNGMGMMHGDRTGMSGGGMGMMQGGRMGMSGSGMGMMQGGRMGMPDMAALNALDLDDEQRSELLDIRSTYRKEHMDRIAEMMDLRDEMQVTMAGERPDPDRVEELHSRIASIHGEMMANRIRLQNDIDDVLTDEQRQHMQQRMGSSGKGMHGDRQNTQGQQPEAER